MGLIKCTECGKEYSEYSEFCPNCHCPTEIVLKSLSNTKDDSSDNSVKKNENKKIKGNKYTLVIIITLIALCLFGFLYTMSRNQIVSYMGNRTVDYDSANYRHRVFWTFFDQNNKAMKANASIKLVIRDVYSNVLYDKTTSVDSSYYSDWTNMFQDNAKLKGCIYINDNEILPGASETGTLSIYTEIPETGSYFEEETIKIDNLPTKDIDIVLSNPLPQSIRYSFCGTLYTIVDVVDVRYSYQYYDWDNSVTLTLSFTTKMTYNKNGNNSSDYSYITYKIYDSNGNIVESGDQIISPSSVGQSVVSDAIIFNLSLNESYTIEIVDTN